MPIQETLREIDISRSKAVLCGAVKFDDRGMTIIMRKMAPAVGMMKRYNGKNGYEDFVVG